MQPTPAYNCCGWNPTRTVQPYNINLIYVSPKVEQGLCLKAKSKNKPQIFITVQ